MHKEYTLPQIEIIDIESEGVICSSITPMEDIETLE